MFDRQRRLEDQIISKMRAPKTGLRRRVASGWRSRGTNQLDFHGMEQAIDATRGATEIAPLHDGSRKIRSLLRGRLGTRFAGYLESIYPKIRKDPGGDKIRPQCLRSGGFAVVQASIASANAPRATPRSASLTTLLLKLTDEFPPGKVRSR